MLNAVDAVVLFATLNAIVAVGVYLTGKLITKH
jgi:hypothetical protein